MGEIKSTLDLVMEKTRHLSLSSAEKQKQKSIEIENRIKDLLQKYEDQIVSTDNLKTEFDKIKTEFSLSDDTNFIKKIFL